MCLVHESVGLWVNIRNWLSIQQSSQPKCHRIIAKINVSPGHPSYLYLAMDEVIKRKFIGLAIEPIHIGSRKKSDNFSQTKANVACDIDGLPIIPATSLKGCVRAYSSSYYGVKECDGKGLNCPQPHRCASSSVFGFTNYHHGKDSSSLVRFSSAKLVLAPIKTSSGIVWVTTKGRLLT